jgi:hypothetical protein
VDHILSQVSPVIVPAYSVPRIQSIAISILEKSNCLACNIEFQIKVSSLYFYALNSVGNKFLAIVKWKMTKYILFLISNFRRVLNVVCCLLGNSPASEFYMPKFRNTLSVPSSHLSFYADGTDTVIRNVVIYNSDAGELLRRKHTTIYLISHCLHSEPAVILRLGFEISCLES